MEWRFTPEAGRQFEALPAGYREALTTRLDLAVRDITAKAAFFQLVINDLEVSGAVSDGVLVLDKLTVRPRGFERP